MASIVINGSPVVSNPPVKRIEVLPGVDVQQIEFTYSQDNDIVAVRIVTVDNPDVVGGLRLER